MDRNTILLSKVLFIFLIIQLFIFLIPGLGIYFEFIDKNFNWIYDLKEVK